ncbi:hypothetical protein Pelo_8424 [Pelomyxa schiedti]|nr:hypothetical protein Pelo_8424 [Pelomyxa schiedti]
MNLEKVSWPAFAERFQMIFGIWIGDLGACVLGNTGPYITETRWLGLLKYWSNRDNSGPDAKIIAMWRTSFYEGWFVGFLSDLESSQRVRSYQSKWLVRCSSNIPLYTLVYRQEINGTYCLYNSRIGHHQPGQCGIMVDSETEPVWHKIKKNVDRDFCYSIKVSAVARNMLTPEQSVYIQDTKLTVT